MLKNNSMIPVINSRIVNTRDDRGVRFADTKYPDVLLLLSLIIKHFRLAVGHIHLS